MTFIELFAPKGCLSQAQRLQLSERLVTELVSAEGAPTEIVRRARGISWLVVHEPEVWTVGGQPVATDAPCYLVRLSMPGGHLNDDMRGELITRVTRVLAEVGGDPDRPYREPIAWVQIVELPDGNFGTFGRVMSVSDMVDFAANGEVPVRGTAREGPSAGRVTDPVCGMTVVLDADAISADHEGSTYAFCSASCRDSFLADRA
ncbi:MAG: YHS domain-containing protein [Acidimicrobiales bacterium]|jgi:YHS domain-containing protein/phenylpyruvate tautomerase PptA (4-oxalocrotonate tautomerase family)